jgi:AcrR family transcriptional regulator
VLLVVKLTFWSVNVSTDEPDIPGLMCQALRMPVPASTERGQRADEIRRAAIPVFAAQGYRGTSMAELAEAAGVSRPALYQYFENRADLFRAAFQALLEDATDAALAALDAPGTVARRLDGYLQRASGDGYEALAATPHGDELMGARHEFAADVAEAATERARRGLRAFVNSNAEVSPHRRSAVIDLLVLSPAGLKADRPTSAAYRRRLTVLAEAAAGLLGAA